MIRIQRFIQDLAQQQWTDTIELPEWQMQKAKYIRPGEYEYEQENTAVHSLNPLHSNHGTTYFLSKTVEIPAHWEEDAVGLIFETRGEGLLKVNGMPYHGLDRNHGYVPLPKSRVGTAPLLEIELYDPIPEPHDPLNRQAVIQPPIQGIRAALVRVNSSLQSLMYSITVLAESLRALPEKDLKRTRLIRNVHQVMDKMYNEPQRWSEAVWVQHWEEWLAQSVQEEDPEEYRDGFMHLVGQSHIDIAWLWPVRETVRKSSRTFSTMCTLMDEYPEFVYSQSQPQLYAFVKEHYPELYERIKARIAEGRWELVGGMWVEPDLNIPSGESLVRQILYGQNFYQEEFGKRSNIEWLPDTFGYCASLPQLLKLADIPYFMTTKLNWNDTNVFPYDLFHWVGIDGTSVLAYLNHGVNEHTRPKDVDEHWQSYKQKDVHPEQMLLYGHGDGGGGVTNEMVAFAERSHFMVGQPISNFSTAGAFFEEISNNNPKLPKWHGDLYLELHRGTYTTHARNKRSNRKAEVLYGEAEIWGQFAGVEAAQSKSDLDEGWKLIMLNQFHDIIPGTSIPEVYVTSMEEYTKVFALGTSAMEGTLGCIEDRIATDGFDGLPYVVFNSLGWKRGEVVTITGDEKLSGLAAFDHRGIRLPSDLEANGDVLTLSVYVPSIPSFGYATIWLHQAPDANLPALKQDESFPSVWETDFYTLEFNDVGEITRWYDKSMQREWLKPGDKANELQFFHDRPTYWDAWDMDPRFESQRAGVAELISREVVQRGVTQDILRFHWKLNESEIHQDIILYRHQRRVDFKTKVNWAESHKLLKAAFPVDLISAKAAYEIPFGALERPTHNNTSWEQAQFEVCGHRWADISEGNSGVSLLNDCKYGYDIKDQTIRLSLLRAPKWPDEHADQGEHEFTYSLLPHQGDWREAGVVRRAMELNHPVRVVASERHSGTLPAEHSWVHFHSEHVILDTIKASEDGTGTVLRFYESSGGRETVQIQWADACIRTSVVNLLEDEIRPLACHEGKFELTFKPYEIQTVKLVSAD
ncbi:MULTISPECIES: alpha-mannosidase [Paenibacillus]|uniref:alpha-mannosidase n=1 Tax=Paenibacillus pabuli TaxID=1472 RepID=A0A855XLB4_9BACL|nr:MULTISPECIES: alpha-mannosidase [Paenibacillus]PWW33688.1 alpha-mannosidase [Paenibacillus pabuli]PXV99958.1 alpha-mannosidase [Paenibacillus taichungensis]